MQSRTFLLFCGLAIAYAAASYGQDEPVLTGYVTRANSGSDFDVNGIHIVCSGVRRGALESAHGIKVSALGCPGDAPFIGEALIVDGARDEKANTFYATRIENQSQQLGKISGSAVIVAVPAQKSKAAQSSGFVIRADGYRIRITGKTKMEWNPPLPSLVEMCAGDWIKYKGKLDAAGVLEASFVGIGPGAIGSREEKLRADNEYDPSAVPAKSRQNFLRDAVAGNFDPKKFPPFQDPEMQARIVKIGNSLIPAFQRALPASDPTKIDFRFQLIDTKLLRDALALPSGIILVPHQVVERMQNDSQLATVLADGIARILERQNYRTDREHNLTHAAMFAGPFVPYAGSDIVGGGAYTEMGILKKEREQRGRVSLALLHDAGYDVNQAPIAWWLLDPWKPRSLSEIEMPERAGYLYSILGEIWNNPAVPAPKVR